MACDSMVFMLWMLTAMVTAGAKAGYVPDGAEFAIESMTQHHNGSYNILQMEVSFYRPDLKLVWLVRYNVFRMPVTSEVATELGIFIDESTSPQGHITTTLWQKMQPYTTDGFRVTQPSIQSADGRLAIIYTNIGIRNYASPVSTLYIKRPPQQRYVTRRPPPVARWSDEKAAQVTAEVWARNPDEGELYIRFVRSEDPFEGPSLVYSDSQPATSVDGVSVTVEREDINGFRRSFITVQAQRSGLVVIVIDSSLSGTEHMAMYTDSLTTQQETWLDGQGYRVRFLQPREGEDQVENGKDFTVHCQVLGADVSPQMVQLRLNGKKLSGVSYGSYMAFPGSLSVLYKGNGSDEGEFECRVEDDTTGMFQSAFTSVTRY